MHVLQNSDLVSPPPLQTSTSQSLDSELIKRAEEKQSWPDAQVHTAALHSHCGEQLGFRH